MKALIIDDEPMPAKQLAQMIDKYCLDVSHVEICLRASKGLSMLEASHYELLFLDIEMPGMSGLEFARQAALPETTRVIFTTAYQQYAVEAFELQASHYLVKPVKEAALLEAVGKASQELRQQAALAQDKRKLISVFNDQEHHIILQEDIIRLEADGSYCRLVMANQSLLSSKSIGYYEGKLFKSWFFRPHKSHVINLNVVSKLHKGRGGYIVLSNGDLVPLTESKQEAFERALGL